MISPGTNQIESKEEQENEPPTIPDIELAIQSMTNTKHPHQILKKGQLLTNMMHNLIKRIWIEEKVPVEWKTNIIVPIYKNKGEKIQCHNYKGI